MKKENIISYFAKQNNIIVGILNVERLDFIEEYLKNTETPLVPKEIEKRLNPKLVMEDAQNIIVIGVIIIKK